MVLAVWLAETIKLVATALAPALRVRLSVGELVWIHKPTIHIVALVVQLVRLGLLVPAEPAHAPTLSKCVAAPVWIHLRATATVERVEQLAVKVSVSVFLVHVAHSRRLVKTTQFVARVPHSVLRTPAVMLPKSV